MHYVMCCVSWWYLLANTECQLRLQGGYYSHERRTSVEVNMCMHTASSCCVCVSYWATQAVHMQYSGFVSVDLVCWFQLITVGWVIGHHTAVFVSVRISSLSVDIDRDLDIGPIWNRVMWWPINHTIKLV